MEDFKVTNVSKIRGIILKNRKMGSFLKNLSQIYQIRPFKGRNVCIFSNRQKDGKNIF